MADRMDRESGGERQAGPLLSVDIVLRSDAWRRAGIDEHLLERAAQSAYLTAAGSEGAGAEVAVALSSDEEVRRLNATWRDKDTPTNVLSFPAANEAAPHGDVRMLGDVVLAFETVRAEARASALVLSDHAAHLVVHGVLHLLGHDHENDADARRMETLERQILTGLGVADPYAVADAAESA